jgi:hypothetical protein
LQTASGETALAFLARVFLSRTGATQGRIDLRIIAVDHLVVAAYASVRPLPSMPACRAAVQDCAAPAAVTALDSQQHHVAR